MLSKEKPEMKLYDTVLLVDDTLETPLNSIGTIVQIWEEKKKYEVEFFDKDWKTISCETLCPDQFRKLAEEELENIKKRP